MTNSNKHVAVIQTGVANTASVLAAFNRLGSKAKLTTNPKEVETADYLVLPGVGSFHAGMNTLNELKLTETIRERIQANKPTLTVCLGLQLLCNASEESPGVKGLSIVPTTISKFTPTVKIPQLGWNVVEPRKESRFIDKGFAYFANSYKMQSCPKGWIASITYYGEEFVSALEQGNILACQFHPELSGTWGLGIIKRWLNQC